MKHFLFLIILAFTTVSVAQMERETYQRAKISFNEDIDLSRLDALGIATDHGIRKKDHYLIAEFSKNDLELIRSNGFQVDVLVADARALFLEQNRTNKSTYKRSSCDGDLGNDYPTPANFNQGSMGGYLTYQEVLDELDDMRALYPELISEPSDINDFVTEGQPNDAVTPSIGGNGIKWVRISDNADTDENEPEILYTSIHHAREPMSLMQNIYYMWYLLENYDTDEEIKSIVDNTELYFVPIVNPDGYLHNEFTNPNGGGFWRKNRKNGNGVDNNRNYDYFINGDSDNGVWGGSGSSGNPSSDIYRGPSPISEVENQAIKWLLEQHNFVIALNSHTSGELLYYPFAYNGQATPDEAIFVDMAAELTSRNDYFELRDCCFSGDSDDFMYGTVGTHNPIFAFTPEIGTSFWPPAGNIDPVCKEMMYQNITAARMANNYGRLHETAALFTGDETSAIASFEIKNFSVSGDGNFTVSLNPITENITNSGTPVNFNNLELLAIETGIITYEIDPATTYGDPVVYELIINNGLYDTALRVEKIYGSANQVFTDEGDSVSVNFDTDSWGTTSSFFVSPSSSITDSPNRNYRNNENNTIELKEPIELTDAISASVSFQARWDIEANFDYVQFQISTDGGNNWEAQCGEFTSTGATAQDEGQPLYDGVQNDWIREQIDLSAYLDNTILARFQLVTDGGNTADGFYFDDLEFTVLKDEELSVDDTAFAKAFSTYPNPVSNAFNIVTSLNDYTMTMYNLQGQRIKTISNLSGNQTIDYSIYASGMYFVQLKSQGRVTTVKVIKK
ncbi:T9SS C-terminal target domain-containing protein [Dokdonia sinensis]|uniref:T9SS C-terminal target domain-containing protein n=1 Tax=Dokdonia sinensis TaxID=2479847 RepID=A0A3M0G7U9_9FLAO|nr:M14 family zinc carboxypeptidase [Dokdonia sinensis]RMB61091.1 T9SS C-terminal target domain-containing protein [Dokdonia sinensis]